jgi:cytochrome c peroxidase
MLNSRTTIRTVIAGGFLALAAAPAAGQIVLPTFVRGGQHPLQLPPVFVPPENPITEEKRILGKILFWDEQLSSDNTRSCGSCHFPAFGGTDGEEFPSPGPDESFGTDDDKFTSRGIIRALRNGEYDPDPAFGLDPQATGRSAPSALMAAYFGQLFWDGRAVGEFRDPETGEIVIAIGGTLESQAVGPIMSPAEMAHQDRNWTEVSAKLARSVPMALGRDLPVDIDGALGSGATYPDLFADAFGDGAISARRISMAIATYERTLVPDRTPWDRFIAGETDAMTPEQTEGWQRFTGNLCTVCHVPPLFADQEFHSIGVRPDSEDPGLAGVTKHKQDRGFFRTTSLRNAGIKANFMHTGGVRTLEDVFDLYAMETDEEVNPNRSLFLPVVLSPFEEGLIDHFIRTALTDPRAANEEFPFDRPALYEEWAGDAWAGGNPALLGGGTPGSGDARPRAIAVIPPNIGNAEFRIGLADALGGAVAHVAVSGQPPVDGVVSPASLEGPFVLAGSGPAEGYATFMMPIPPDATREGEVLYLQWRIDDPAADGGIALSPPVRIELFCNGRCPDGEPGDCPADIAAPQGVLDLADLGAFVSAFLAGESSADLAPPMGEWDLADVQAFLGSFLAGCP